MTQKDETTHGSMSFRRISRGTGRPTERFFCRLRGGHKPGERMPDWFSGGPGRICERCGKVIADA